MELTGYLAVARRWWWTLLVATWVAAMAGLLVATRITPTYEAQAQLLVGPINTDSDTLRASGLLVQTYALTGDLPASRSAVRDAFVAAWHHWRKVSRLEDPESWVRPHAWQHAQPVM